MKASGWALLIVGAVWLHGEWHAIERNSTDFRECNEQATRAEMDHQRLLQMEGVPGDSPRIWHDAVDSSIDFCMHIRGYIYRPDGYSDGLCAHEKLNNCYRKPFLYRMLD